MANILITNACNANCSFCFAREQTRQQAKFLSMAAVEERLLFLQHSDVDQARLMGGEPTLHPQFQEIVSRVMSTGMKLAVFSNGFIPEKALTCLSEFPAERCAILINVNALEAAPKFQDKLLKVLRTLQEKVTLGFTVVNPSFDLLNYFKWIKIYGLQRKIRLGLAMPIYGGDNRFLPPKHYPATARSVLLNAVKAHEQGIDLEFDCGFVQCMFTKEESQALEKLGVKLESQCAPNLDIGVDGNIFHCFCLSNLYIGMKEAPIVRKAVDVLNEQRRSFRESGIYPECAHCPERVRGHCCAGCLSMTMRRFHQGAVQVQ